MTRIPFIAQAIVFYALVAATSTQAAGPLTTLKPDGQVALVADSNNDRIADFSWCGYRGGGVAIPQVPVAVSVAPAPSGDDTARIQKAIDEVSARTPTADGIRGAVLLAKGAYRVEGTLTIKTSGVVLRGAGQGEDGTVLHATGKKKRSLIYFGSSAKPQRDSKATFEITNDRIPAGSQTVDVANNTGLAVGDRVTVVRRSNTDWIRLIGMEGFSGKDGDDVGWTPEAYTIGYERRITAKRGNSITFDVPLVMAIEKRFGGGFVSKVNCQRITQAGIENLRMDSDYQKGAETTDEEHAWTGIEVRGAEDVWVRNVTGLHFGNGTVALQGTALRVTVADCANLDPVSKIEGGRRYSFTASGQQGLFIRCYSRGGRHDFVQGARTPGPNAFVDCLAEEANSASEPHHRFSTGTLYDNVVVTGARSGLSVGNRGDSGTGHGWSGAWVTFWNCGSAVIIVMEPPTARNAAIGTRPVKAGNDGTNLWHWFEKQSGQKLTRTGLVVHDTGSWITSADAPVQPRSLYFSQLAARLGSGAVQNVATPVQRTGNWPDIETYLRSLAR